ncbi:MAG: crotonase/enoyl-CoA hydratase family protein [Pseudomonadota bacterium]
MADIEISRREGVQTIRFNRADKKNAITRAMYADMAAALNEADAHDDIRASVFLGQPEVFTSGNDIMDFMAVAQGGEKGTEVLDFLRALIAGEKPMVSAIDGLAVGVGCTMLMHCDLVYATPRSWVQTPFVDLGLVPEAGSSLVAPAIMGPQNAFALLALGEKFSAEKACSVGLVNAVVEPEQLEELALSKAAALAAKPPQALAIARRLIRGDRDVVMKRMEEEGKLFFERLQSDEARMAFMGFMQKKAG